jgi:predicted alpha/beta superfamily hydrolase
MKSAFLLLLICLYVTLASIVKFEIHYPEEYILPTEDGSIFWLYVCYMPGCPSNAAWNQSGPSFTISMQDSISQNIFMKEILLNNYDGPVYITITGAQSGATNKYSITTCIPGNGCNALGVPYITELSTTTSTNTIVAYPWFEVNPGHVYTMLPNFYSPQFQNYRDISVYIPPSIYQNTLSRPIYIVVVNDGTRLFLEQLATLGGLDRAVQTGAIPSNTILVGIPQNASSFCDRMYELSYEKCREGQSVCQDCATGGNFLLFDFIQENVIPAVLQNLSMSLGEVSMTGYSLGGLTACVAASFRPSYYQRALCLSPSVWWNDGSLADNITSNTKLYGLPKSVVMYIGTDEAFQSYMPRWFENYNDTVDAWLHAGMTNTTLTSFAFNGGLHMLSYWVDVFALGIVRMYAQDFPTKTLQQASFDENIDFYFPNATIDSLPCPHICDDDNSEDEEEKSYYRKIIFALLTVITVIIVANVGFLLWYFEVIHIESCSKKQLDERQRQRILFQRNRLYSPLTSTEGED